MRYAPNTAADRVTARHVPPNSIEERHDELQAVVYTYTSAQRRAARNRPPAPPTDRRFITASGATTHRALFV